MSLVWPKWSPCAYRGPAEKFPTSNGQYNALLVVVLTFSSLFLGKHHHRVERSANDLTCTTMEYRSEESASMGSLGDDEGSQHPGRSEEWQSVEEERSGHDGSAHSYSDSHASEESGSYQSEDIEERSENSEGKLHGEDQLDESMDLKAAISEDTEGQSLVSGDETDTCLLSIDEHVQRRRAKLALRELRESQEIKMAESADSGSNQMRSDDETDTCLLSIDEHVRRRQGKWAKLRNGVEAIDLTCLDSDVGTLEETTLVSVEEEDEVYDDEDDEFSEESISVEIRTLGTRTVESGTIESATLGSGPTEKLITASERKAENKRTENWRIKNWRSEAKEEAPDEKDRALKGVDYMSAFDIASTNKDISVVEAGISRKAAREAFEKKQVPDEIPMMLRDDVSSIYPPVRPATKPHPLRKAPFNGMILEDPVSLSYDEELGVSTRSYEMSIVGSEEKKRAMAAQRSDLELVLIAIISLSLLILVILLIVILAKNS